MNRAPPFHQFAEATLAAESDAILAEIKRGWQPPYTTSELDQVQRDAMKAIARNIPDPAEAARDLAAGEPVLAEALCEAWMGQSDPYAGAWRIDERFAAPLRSRGIVEARGFGLTAYGISVRRVLVGWRA